MLRLPNGRVVNPSGPLGKRLVAAHVTHVLTCMFCGKRHGNGRGPWRVPTA
jgi:hypothetical protein